MKRLFCFVFALFLLMLPICVSAKADVPYINDEAGKLSLSQVKELEALAQSVSKKHGIDVAVLIVNSLDGRNEVFYADDYYDEYFGDDGVLLLFSVEDDIKYISTCGDCIDAIDDYLAESFGGVSASLDSGDVAQAVEEYINTVDSLVSSYKTKSLLIGIGVSLAVGFLVAFIATGKMKSQLDGAKFNVRARDYLKPGSLNISVSRDLYLYRTVNRTPRANNNSSVHRSGSGRTHGGGRI